jgi:hypothetical protein
MAHEDVQDVLRVLAICYREGSTIDALDMERIMSFDMDWLSPEEAEKSVQALIAAGWLTGPENELTPTVALEGVTSPLGWFPRPSRLIKPCQPEKRQTSLTSPPDIEARSTPLPVTSGGPQPQPAVSTPVDSNDPRPGSPNSLLDNHNFQSRKSNGGQKGRRKRSPMRAIGHALRSLQENKVW